MKRVLIVTKQTKKSVLTIEEMGRLPQNAIDKIKASHENHECCVDWLEKVFLNECVLQREHGDVAFRFHQVGEETDDSFFDYNVYITLGGDGTVLYTQKWIQKQPLIAINTDPQNSVGRLCQFEWNCVYEPSFAYKIADELSHALTATDWYQISVPRLTLHIGKTERTFLNDVLFTNENPAEMSVYNLKVGNCVDEIQRSSGMWVSTASGSTGGIHSAGVYPVDPTQNVLLWKTREPYEGAGKCWYKEGGVFYDKEAKVFEVTALNKGMAFYVDGSFHKIPLAIGESAYIIHASNNLTLKGSR